MLFASPDDRVQLAGFAKWADRRGRCVPGSFQSYLDQITLESHGIGAGSGSLARAVDPSAVFQAESPPVPGAGHRLVEDDPVAKGCPLVWAGVVDGKVVSFVQKDRDRAPLDLHGYPAPLGNLAHSGDSVIH